RAAALRDEVDALKSQLRQVETEKRLLEELEVSKLRGRIAELEAELRGARGQPAAASGVDMMAMRGMLKELVQEVGAGRAASSGGDVAAEIAKLQNAILSMGRGGGAQGPVTDADAEAMRVSLSALFTHEDKGQVESNIGNVSVKE